MVGSRVPVVVPPKGVPPPYGSFVDASHTPVGESRVKRLLVVLLVVQRVLCCCKTAATTVPTVWRCHALVHGSQSVRVDKMIKHDSDSMVVSVEVNA